VGIVEGMGRETDWPSMMGLGHLPAALSNPFRLKMIFIFTFVRCPDKERIFENASFATDLKR